MSKFNAVYNKVEGFLTISQLESSPDLVIVSTKESQLNLMTEAKPEPCLLCSICDSDTVHLRLCDHMREAHISFAKLDDPSDPFYERGEASRLRAAGRTKLCELLSGEPDMHQMLPFRIWQNKPVSLHKLKRLAFVFTRMNLILKLT